MEAVQMLPTLERTADLPISELPILLVVKVFGDPAYAKWADPVAEYDAGTVVDAGRAALDANTFPGRDEPVECTRSLVPGERFFDRNRQKSLHG